MASINFRSDQGGVNQMASRWGGGPVATAPFTSPSPSPSDQITPPPSPAPTASNPLDFMSSGYKQYLGRNPVEGEAARWLSMGGKSANDWSNPQYLQQRLGDLQQTTEAQNYAARGAAPQAPPPGGGGGDPAAFIANWQRTHAPSEGKAPLIAALKQAGFNADQWMYGSTPSGNEISLNGQRTKVFSGDEGTPGVSWYVPGSEQSGGMPDVSSYMAQFNDPSTKLLEQYLTQQMASLNSQRAAQQQANEALKAKMPDIQASTDRLIAYLNSRAQQLQAGPYTGQQQEILRTQALDPIEADRTAANKRALEQISARGLTPESGISQDLMNQVNATFDKARAGAQGNIAYQSIAQDQANKNQAQQLLGLVPSVQRAAATGDLSFLQALDAAVNQPASQAINLATVNQRLPSQAMNDALAVMGAGPGADSIYNQALGLYNTQSQHASQNDYAWGQMLAYLLGGH